MTTLLDRLGEEVAQLPDGHPNTTWRTYAHIKLHDWLGTVRARGYALQFEDGHAHIGPGSDGRRAHPVIRDYWMLKRHNHALCIAAAGEHKAWWSFASGQSNVPPSIADVPTSPADPDSFACATCAAPAFDIDDRAIAWCQGHAL